MVAPCRSARRAILRDRGHREHGYKNERAYRGETPKHEMPCRVAGPQFCARAAPRAPTVSALRCSATSTHEWHDPKVEHKYNTPPPRYEPEPRKVHSDR